MPNRYTDTAKWEDDWFAALSLKHKVFWLFLCDRCDHAGIWKASGHVASVLIGEPIDLQEALCAFGPERIEVYGDKWFLKKFIRFQQKSLLNKANPAHRSILSILEQHGIPTSPYEAPSEPLGSHSGTLKQPLPNPSKKRRKIATEKSVLTVPPGFEKWYAKYPKKKARADAEKAWTQMNPPLDAALKALEWQVSDADWTKDGGKFIPFPATYLRARRWEDQRTEARPSRPETTEEALDRVLRQRRERGQ